VAESTGHTTVAKMGKAHRIHDWVNNHQATELEALGTIAKQTLVFVRSRCSRGFILDYAEGI
jgi:hypothetical protein